MKKKKNRKNPDERHVLLNEIALTRTALDTAISNFENVIDPDLIDCYIYQLNSEEKRYKYLLKQAKEFKINEPELLIPRLR